MENRTLSAKDRIILPLDVASMDPARALANRLQDRVGLFKIGLELFASEGPGALHEIRRTAPNRIFLDLKLHDIPETVRRSVAALLPLSDGIEFMTVHTGGGLRMLKAAVKETKGRLKILGVTVLTSSSDEEGEGREPISARVVSLARRAQDAGCAGVVCSSEEAQSVRRECGREFIIVTPGIRPKWSTVEGDDQRRVMTPSEAILQGADYLVIGRPIVRAEDPEQSADRIAAEIEQALRQRTG